MKIFSLNPSKIVMTLLLMGINLVVVHAQWYQSGSNSTYYNGRVSIGASGFSGMLTVNGLGDYYSAGFNARNVLTLATAGQAANMAITFNTQASDNMLRAIVAGYGSQDLHFMRSTYGGYDQVSDLTIASNGNVGIGTTTPENKLTVNGDIKFSQYLFTNGRMHTYGGEYLYILNKQGVVIGKEWGGTGNLSVQGDLSVSGKILLNGVPLSTTGGSGGSSGGWVSETNGVYNNGRVSIGKSGYSAKLVVNGTGDYYNTAWNIKNVMTLATAGEVTNMAITFNTVTPDNKLRAIVAGYGTQDLHFMRSTFGGADPVTDFIIKSNGNVGVGTTEPDAKLAVNGNASIGGALRLKNYTSSSPVSTPTGKVLSVDSNGDLILVPYGSTLELEPKIASEQAEPQQSSVFRTEYMYVRRRVVVHGGEAPEDVMTSGNFRMWVKGGIITDKIKVANRGGINWSDYVFEDNYKLPTLKQVEAYIKINRHLPNIPSKDEVSKEGIDVAEMDAKLLAKIEELTLYLLQQSKKIEELEQKINSLEQTK